MKRLILLRHAKAEPPDPGGDHVRPLAPRGVSQAMLVGRTMEQRGWLPDLALVSDARRTQETYEEVAAILGEATTVRFSPELYDASAARILEAVRQASDGAGCLLVVGHNPGVHEVAQLLSQPGQSPDAQRLASDFPPATMAVLRFDVTRWSQVGPAAGQIEACIRTA